MQFLQECIYTVTSSIVPLNTQASQLQQDLWLAVPFFQIYGQTLLSQKFFGHAFLRLAREHPVPMSISLLLPRGVEEANIDPIKHLLHPTTRQTMSATLLISSLLHQD